MRYFSILGMLLLALVSMSWAANNNSDDRTAIDQELSNATQIMDEMTGPNATAGIPESILQNAKCIAVVPDMIQAGFVVGGRHGSGVATCKLSGNRWSMPAPFQLSGASWGAQIGAQSIDLVMMIMNDHGMQALRTGHFKVGGEISGAAGPVGRQASASTGFGAGILTYSRTKGVYAGITLKGAELQQDDGGTKALYGNDVSFSKILDGNVPSPASAKAVTFVSTIEHAEQTARSR
jgi:lipid-binding SYLF domain-containing protein